MEDYYCHLTLLTERSTTVYLVFVLLLWTTAMYYQFILINFFSSLTCLQPIFPVQKSWDNPGDFALHGTENLVLE